MSRVGWKRRVLALPPWLPAAVGAALTLGAIAYQTLGPDAEPEELVVAEASQSAFALLYVADAKGFFRDERVNVRFATFGLGRDALDSVIAGRADIATVYPTPTLIRLHEGNSLGIVSTLHTSTRSHVLVARRDRGIAAPADLRGRTIGVTRGTSTESFLSAFLAEQGIAASEVRIESVEPPAYARALSDGALDALVAFNPHPALLERAIGKDRLSVFPSDVYVEASMLVGVRARLDSKREAVQRMLRALARAQRHAARHREESILIVAERLMTSQPEHAIRRGWDALRPAIGLDHVLLGTLSMEAEWLRSARKFQGPDVDLEAALAPQYLGAASPEAVTLVPRRKLIH